MNYDDDVPEPWCQSLPSVWKLSKQHEHLAPGYLKNCSVKPCGVFRDFCFYQLPGGKVVALLWDDHTPDAIRALFTDHPEELTKFWDGEHSIASSGKTIMRGWLPSAAADSLRMACCHMGIVFPPQVGLQLTALGMIEGPVIPAPWVLML